MKLLHLLLFVYWLGADVGTFYASRFVADAALTPAARATAAKIMLGVDLLPRVTMPMALATGVHLAVSLNVLPLGSAALISAVLIGVWLLCLAWLAMVLTIHHFGSSPRGAALVRFDFGFRVLLVLGIVVLAVPAWWGGAPAVASGMAPWLVIKLLAFAATVACGLLIRVQLRPFGPAFAQLMREGSRPDTEAAIAGSIARCKPYVIVIWVLLVVCAAAGLHLIG